MARWQCHSHLSIYPITSLFGHHVLGIPQPDLPKSGHSRSTTMIRNTEHSSSSFTTSCGRASREDRDRVDITCVNSASCRSGSSVYDVVARLMACTSVFHRCCDRSSGRGPDMMIVTTECEDHRWATGMSASIALFYLFFVHSSPPQSGTCTLRKDPATDVAR